jgi:hypothetical protein
MKIIPFPEPQIDWDADEPPYGYPEQIVLLFIARKKINFFIERNAEDLTLAQMEQAFRNLGNELLEIAWYLKQAQEDIPEEPLELGVEAFRRRYYERRQRADNPVRQK